MSILLYDKMTMFNLINLCINLSVCLMSLGKEIFYFIMTKVRSAGFPGVGEHFVRYRAGTWFFRLLPNLNLKKVFGEIWDKNWIQIQTDNLDLIDNYRNKPFDVNIFRRKSVKLIMKKYADR